MSDDAPDTVDVKVVDIINDREIALSGGGIQGLEVDDVLRIVSAKPRVIKDPEGEVLGEIVQTKAVVRVYDVQPKFALARTFRTREVNVGGQGGGVLAFGRIFDPPKYETRVETLRRDPTKGAPVTNPDDLVVQIGDLAEKVERSSVDDIPSASIWR